MEQIRISCLNATEYERRGEDLIEFAKGKMLNSEELINSMQVVFAASSAQEKVSFEVSGLILYCFKALLKRETI